MNPQDGLQPPGEPTLTATCMQQPHSPTSRKHGQPSAVYCPAICFDRRHHCRCERPCITRCWATASRTTHGERLGNGRDQSLLTGRYWSRPVATGRDQSANAAHRVHVAAMHPPRSATPRTEQPHVCLITQSSPCRCPSTRHGRCARPPTTCLLLTRLVVLTDTLLCLPCRVTLSDRLTSAFATVWDPPISATRSHGIVRTARSFSSLRSACRRVRGDKPLRAALRLVDATATH